MTRAKGTLITPDGSLKEITFKGNLVSLKEMQDCVEGYIEMVWLKDGKILIVNEEGKINGLPVNDQASIIVNDQGIYDIIVGNALLIESKFVD